MRKYNNNNNNNNNQGVCLYTKVAKSIAVKSTAIYRYHSKI